MPKVSIIIPVYNVEKYLRECLDSVCNQTLTDIEIICINDGSTDDSLGILNEYAQNDKRIIVVDKDNEGVSVARNIGIDKSTGEYLCFLDSDDWLEKDILEKSYNKISNTNSNIICFGIKEYFDGYTKIRKDFDVILDHCDDLVLDKSTIKEFLVNAASKLYRTDYIKNNNIYFLSGIKSCEDGIFNLFCLYNDTKWCLLPEVGYNYRRNRNGSTTNRSDLMIETDIEGFEKVISHPLFVNTSKENKIITIEKFLWHFRSNFTRKDAIKNICLIQNFKKYLYKNVDNEILKAVPNIKEFRRYTIFRYILQTIFDIRNEYNGEIKTKVITIFGLKFRIKIGDKNAES